MATISVPLDKITSTNYAHGDVFLGSVERDPEVKGAVRLRDGIAYPNLDAQLGSLGVVLGDALPGDGTRATWHELHALEA